MSSGISIRRQCSSSAGSRRRAEARVIAAVERAADQYFDGIADEPGVWLEDTLVRSFLDEDQPHDHETGSDAVAEPSRRAVVARRFVSRLPGRSPSQAVPPARFFTGLTRERVYEAAGALPSAPRAAIWLVQFRRRSYAAAAETLGVGEDELRRLLRYREAFLAELVRLRGAESRGTRRA